MEAVGNCRSCMVEIAGERVLAPSCCRAPSAGMKVTTNSERALKSQKLVLELLLADMAQTAYTRHNEVDEWARKLGVGKPRFEARAKVAQDLSHPAIAVNLDALHPVHTLLARLPRRTGQRRDRSGLPRRPGEDRVRHGRSDGRVHLCGLRRMCAGLARPEP